MSALWHGVLIGTAATLFALLVLSPALAAFMGCTCFDDPQLDDDEDDDPATFGPVAKWGMNGDTQ